jgi:hypothetical protein
MVLTTRQLLNRVWEQTHRRNFLTESSYKLPADGRMAMYDWYALYALWFNKGSGRAALGYVERDFLPARHGEVIDNTFEECSRQLALRMVGGIKFAIADEMMNLNDPFLIPEEPVLLYAAEYGPPYNKLIDVNAKPDEENVVHLVNVPGHLLFWKKFSYSDCVKIFNAPFWEKWADAYGGQKWAEITQYCMELHSALKSGDLKTMIGLIDKIYDLEHNTGTLMSKLPYLKVTLTDLNNRARLRSIEDFLPHVSSDARKVIKPTLMNLRPVQKESLPPRPSTLTLRDDR